MAAKQDHLKALKVRLKRLSHETNVLLAASQYFAEQPPSSEQLTRLIGAAGGKPDTKIRMTEAQIAKEQERLVANVVDLLLVRLEAEVHGFLDNVMDKDPNENSESLENLCNKIEKGFAEKSRGRDYKDLILLACIRNAIVHADGIVRWDGKAANRLTNAGWTEKAFSVESSAKPPRTFGDFLRFKKVVRSIATQLASGPAADTTGNSKRR